MVIKLNEKRVILTGYAAAPSFAMKTRRSMK